jgi:hypothetical protein
MQEPIPTQKLSASMTVRSVWTGYDEWRTAVLDLHLHGIRELAKHVASGFSSRHETHRVSVTASTTACSYVLRHQVVRVTLHNGLYLTPMTSYIHFWYSWTSPFTYGMSRGELNKDDTLNTKKHPVSHWLHGQPINSGPSSRNDILRSTIRLSGIHNVLSGCKAYSLTSHQHTTHRRSWYSSSVTATWM